MTKYAKNAKEFEVSLSHSKNKDGSQSLICRVPKKVIEVLDNPTKIKFVIKPKSIVVEAGEK